MADIPESLAERLRSLGVKTGTNVPPHPAKARTRIEDVVDGSFIQTSFGEVFKKDTFNEQSYTHGNVTFEFSEISSRLMKWAGSKVQSDSVDLFSTIFLDTETTGLAGGTGTFPFMIGVGRFTPSGFITSQIFTRNPSEERAQLDLLDRMMSGVTSIVTYNGKSFDIPILKTRYVLNDLPSPFADILHFDLLPLSRRLWRRRLDSRSLKDIESEVLGFSRGQLEVPGWEVPVIYFNYLRTGDPSQLAGVFYHNAVDIQSLAALFLFINRLAENPMGTEENHALDHLSLAIQLELNGEVDQAMSIYEHLIKVDLPEIYSVELKIRYAKILKKIGSFDHAADVLNSGKELNDLRLLIQLAKVLEHQRRDYANALETTERALDVIRRANTGICTSIPSGYIDDLEKRKRRLIDKLKSNNGGHHDQ